MDYFESFGINVEEGRDHEKAVYSIALLYNLLHSRISDYLSKYDFTIGKLNVLYAIKTLAKTEGVKQVEISKRLIVTPANMTRLLDKLEKDGLVTRGAKEGDRRVNIVKITTKGDNLIEKLWPGYLEVIDEVSAVIPKDDQKILAKKISNWVSKLAA